MNDARSGLSVQSIQFLGRWQSSAVFRYIEEAMTEIPLNTMTSESSMMTATKIPEVS